MTDTRIDVPNDEVEWDALLGRLASAASFAEMVGPIYSSGATLSDYQSHLEPDVDDLLEYGDLTKLRAYLTALVREDHFSPGSGDAYFWGGDLDQVIDEIAKRAGSFYPLPLAEYVLPRRLPPCPECGRTDETQYRMYGMPPGPPADFDESRVIFEGCMIEVPSKPSFHCRRCEVDYSAPGLEELDLWEFD